MLRLRSNSTCRREQDAFGLSRTAVRQQTLMHGQNSKPGISTARSGYAVVGGWLYHCGRPTLPGPPSRGGTGGRAPGTPWGDRAGCGA